MPAARPAAGRPAPGSGPPLPPSPDNTRVPRNVQGKGRKIDAGGDVAPEVAPQSAPPRAGGELSPFQGYGAAPPAGPQSNEPIRVVGMLAALGMTFGAVVAVMIAVVCSGVVLSDWMKPAEDGPEQVATDDTDVEIRGPRAEKVKVKPRGPGTPEPEVVTGPLPEVFGTVILDLKPGQVFNTIEAKCPSTPLVRRRADIRSSKVTIKLPPEEECRVTFQGSSPEYTQLRGGQTKTCQFSPTRCK